MEEQGSKAGDGRETPTKPVMPPRLVQELNAENIVLFKDFYFLVRHDLGPLDLASLSDMELFALPNSKNLRDFTEGLSKDIGPESETVVKLYGGYNIFLFEGVYFAIPENSNAFDFTKDDLMERPDIRYDVALDALEELITDENALKKKEDGV